MKILYPHEHFDMKNRQKNDNEEIVNSFKLVSDRQKLLNLVKTPLNIALKESDVTTWLLLPVVPACKNVKGQFFISYEFEFHACVFSVHKIHKIVYNHKLTRMS